jgi:hypothetical protein
MTHDATFFSVSNARYMPGLVAMVNSIRLTGHRHRIIVGDCGLTPAQRALLEQECTVVDLPPEYATNPVVFKPFPRLVDPKGVVVLVDADMIVAGSLQPIIELAALGKFCAFPDPESGRWFAEWQQLFELQAPPRRQTYLCAGFAAFSTDHFPDFLEHWWRSSVRVPPHRTLAGGAPNSDPVAQADQDAMNALLMSEVDPCAIHPLPMDAMPVFSSLARTRVADANTLACRLGQRPSLLLHAAGAGKPWDGRRGWKKVRRDAYTLLARRLLAGDDLPLRLPSTDLPIWMQAGTSAELALRTLDTLNRALLPARIHVTPRIRQGYRRLRPLS